MSKLSKLFLMVFFTIPFISNGQSISANLKYINEQFSKYNKYETSFRIDEYNKEIICEDKFGILKAKFADVEVRIKGNNIGIFCINSTNECIRGYKKDGTLSSTNYSDYTMGLREDDKIVSHANTVITKFSEIKSALVHGTNNFSSTVATNNYGNSITENLKYINEQFRQYNKYNTSFSVDEYNKELICTDKFGTLKAKFEDVEIRAKGNNIGIYCLGADSKCIRTYDEFGNLKANTRNDYTMGLRENEKLIPHINTVLNKFAEIKKTVLGNSDINTYSSGNIEDEIRNINAIFQRSSEYKNVWRFDYNRNAIIGTTKSCHIVVPINSGLSINSYTKEARYGNGWYFQNNDKTILESCTSFEDYTVKTYEYVNSAADASRVISSFRKIIDIVRSGNASGGNSSGGSIAENLTYINRQFNNYNSYNTEFKVDEAKKQLIWTNNFGTTYAYLRDVEVRADYKNNWIGVYCLGDGECIWQITNSNSKSNYKQYTMSLLDNGKMIGHMSKVIQSFEELKRLSLGNTSSNSNSSNDDTDSPD